MGKGRLPLSCAQLAVASLLVLACGASRRGSVDENREARSNQSRIREQTLSARPKFIVIERAGDGAAAIAFAAKTDGPPLANYGLSLILQKRLASFGMASDVSPSAFGQSLMVLVKNAEEASAAIERLQRALSAEVSASEFDEHLVGLLAENFRSGFEDSPADIELSRCSGELYRDARQAEALANKTTLIRWIESARRQAYSQSHASLAVVGSSRVVVAVGARLLALPPWPVAIQQSEPSNTTTQNSPAVKVEASKDWGLSFAWTTGSLRSAVAAWRTLRSPDSTLMAQLSALESDWKISAISAIARPAGACLRIDLSHSNSMSVQGPADVEKVARVVFTESRLALTRSAPLDSLRESELTGLDPSAAVRRAAWQSLSIEQPGESPVLQASLRGPSGKPSELQSALTNALKAPKQMPIELRQILLGEIEQWALVASPCGPSSESIQNSGATAAWVRALARKYSGTQGVVLEPWIASDGIGLLAHATRQSPSDTNDGVALRIGNALGSIFATGKVTGPELAIIREEMLLRLGALPRRAWNLLLDTVSARRPSQLEPFGNVNSVQHLALPDLSWSRHHWLREPIRAAVFASDSKSQVALIDAALTRWLEPHREDARACERLEEYSSEKETQILSYSPDELDASAYMAIRLRQVGEQQEQYGDWLEWLLNRRGGRLERVLVEPGLAQSARAFIRGPRGRLVLFIEIKCADMTATTDAIARVRLLLTDIASSGPSAIELDLANRRAQLRSSQLALDPRNRLVKLWLGESSLRQPSKAGFSPYLARTLDSAPVTIMRVRK
jgi:hypothetical protein